VNSDITQNNDLDWLRDWTLHDGDSPRCCAVAARLERAATRCGYDLARWQSTWVRECLDLGERGGDWRILTKDGRTLLGAGAMAHLSRHFWRDWLWPLMASCPRGLT
jgi:hypothetical protein